MIYHTEAALTRTKIALQKLRSHGEEAHTNTAYPISLESHTSTSSTRLRAAATHIMTAAAAGNAKAGANICRAGCSRSSGYKNEQQRVVHASWKATSTVSSAPHLDPVQQMMKRAGGQKKQGIPVAGW